MQIEISGITCRFGSTPAVDHVDLTVEEGEFVALLGPSGSGKTTLLRVMAGLETPEAGHLTIDGADALTLPPNKRRIGFVFQHYALFRHLSVARNIAFGLEVRPRANRPSGQDIKRRVEELLELVQLPGLGKRYPQQLSGGQRQRVALARALAIEPKILLLDEPFGALDTKVRAELGEWLKALHRRLGLTIVFVTHDQKEAMELADRIVVMRQGRIEQQGTPSVVYANPVSSFVYNFLGAANRLPCRIENGVVHLGPGSLPLGPVSDGPDGPASLWFRPHHVQLAPTGGSLEGVVADIATAGPRSRVGFTYHGSALSADLASEDLPALGLAPHQPCRWWPRDWRIYPDEV
jgi:sulfate transport system ATP-binding protein